MLNLRLGKNKDFIGSKNTQPSMQQILCKHSFVPKMLFSLSSYRYIYVKTGHLGRVKRDSIRDKDGMSEQRSEVLCVKMINSGIATKTHLLAAENVTLQTHLHRQPLSFWVFGVHERQPEKHQRIIISTSGWRYWSSWNMFNHSIYGTSPRYACTCIL